MVKSKHTMSNKLSVRTALIFGMSLIFHTITAAVEHKTTVLRVALFPYIPDAGQDGFQALQHRLKTEFEQKNPEIDLVLRSMKAKGDFYDLDQLKSWLIPAGTNETYDVMEIDTLLLGDLVALGLISPLTVAEHHDWHPAATRSVTINDAIYGVPHLLCGHFVFTRNEAVAKARTVEQLVTALHSIHNNLPDLSGNLLGSWNLPALYLDAWADSHPRESLAFALGISLDPAVTAGFKS